MKKILFVIYKITEQLWARITPPITTSCTRFILYINNIKCGSGLRSYGRPIIHISLKGTCIIGDGFTMCNIPRISATGFSARCKLEVHNGAYLVIGNNVGITATTIMCFNRVTIGNNVLLGVGVHIYDTDFHSINPGDRLDGNNQSVSTRPVTIGDNVFIGAFTIILKGVTIGYNSVVGAGSVVTKNIPSNEVWAGNPAKFIRKIES